MKAKTTMDMTITLNTEQTEQLEKLAKDCWWCGTNDIGSRRWTTLARGICSVGAGCLPRCPLSCMKTTGLPRFVQKTA